MKVELKSLLKKKTTLGTWITIPHRFLVEIAKFNEFDWVCFDIEHSTTNIDQLGSLISVANGSQIASFVRVYGNDPVIIKRVMDAGAAGIIVPMINSKEEALKAYDYMHYPPLGTRGVGLGSAQVYGGNFEAYKKWLADEAALIVQIEHIEAVRNLESILSLSQVDGFIVGPYDLSASLGRPGDFHNPEFVDAMKEIVRVQKKFNKCRGIHIVEPDVQQIKTYADEGFNFIGYSFEARIIEKAFKSAAETLRSHVK